MYLLGIDIGSSSIKAAIVNSKTNQPIAISSYPEIEMDINSPKTGWAEQDPEIWWQNVIAACKKTIKKAQIDGKKIISIGISYQMHGLVIVDKNQNILRPSIIWCDGRAISHGEEAFKAIGENYCIENLLNSPGNFTASKLKWIKENEPNLFDKIDKFMLPGDYIAMKLTGEVNTTIPGLSEGIMYDFKNNKPSKTLFNYLGIDEDLIPEIKPTFSIQGTITKGVAELIGLKEGTPVSYRSGDQPNNAMSLGVLESGEIAATGGTSGVVYGVNSTPVSDPQNRINSFAHVNYSKETPNVGALLCINGCGIQHRWINQQIASKGTTYSDMENIANNIQIGADGLTMLPFGNGAERMLYNKDIGSHINGLQFNRHEQAHLFRAGIEGIAFAFVYGIEIMKSLGMDIESMRVGNDNLFQSNIFSSTVSTLMGGPIEMIETTGAVGAARAAGYGMGHFSNLREAINGDKVIKTYTPEQNKTAYQEAYTLWKKHLNTILQNQ